MVLLLQLWHFATALLVNPYPKWTDRPENNLTVVCINVKTSSDTSGTAGDPEEDLGFSAWWPCRFCPLQAAER
ncbi:hypothetical protein AV530_002096 [Patagioenas fasciata monilis]|uniref:Uncharacterized protein n=1 Tax=Patagioenas fasciata monilis TaxID=372326 RepID=A0A1V4J6W4_PATFA|nr:hypothetical protein AV530_002096 [Patagioenas fasciata monilis]